MPRPSSATTRPMPNNGRAAPASTPADPPSAAPPEGAPEGAASTDTAPSKPAPSAEVARLIAAVRAGRAAAPKVEKALGRVNAAREAHEAAVAARKKELDEATKEWSGLRIAAAEAAGAEVRLIRLAPEDFAQAFDAAYEAESAAHGELIRTKLDLERARQHAESAQADAAEAKKVPAKHQGPKHAAIIEQAQAAADKVGELMKRVRTLERDLKQRGEDLKAAASKAIAAATGGAITTVGEIRRRS